MCKRTDHSNRTGLACLLAGLGLAALVAGQAVASGLPHAAHVHGEAQLLVTQEGNLLAMNLASPAANIVGFEHPALTSAQIRSVQRTKAILESPQALFVFIGTRCELNQAIVDLSALMPPADQGSQRPAQRDSSSSDSHSVVQADYRFDCQQGSALRAIDAQFLGSSFAIGKLHAQWITDDGQGATELTALSKIIELQ